MLKIGNAELRRVEDMLSAMPMSLFTDDQAFLAEQSWLKPDFLDADGNCPMVFHSWILHVDGRIVVVDPCAGNGWDLPGYPMFHQKITPFIERFEATGIKPEDVDYVFCTHLHSDHCGWNTRLREGRYVPTFPNARYVMVKTEFDRWDPRRADYKGIKENEGVFEYSVLPILEAGLADIVDENHSFLPSLMIEPARGHTLGHSTLHLHSDNEHALFIGDTFHAPIQIIDPDLDLGGADDQVAIFSTRRRLIRQCIDLNAILVPAHFPRPYLGQIKEQDGKTVFLPFDAGF